MHSWRRPLLLEPDLQPFSPGRGPPGRIPAGAGASPSLRPAVLTGSRPAALPHHGHPAGLQLVLPAPCAGGEQGGPGWAKGREAAWGSCSPGPSTTTAWGFPAQPPASPRQGPLPPPTDGPPAWQPWRHPGGAGGFLVGLCPPSLSSPRSASQIQPFFSSCLNDCLRHSVSVPCPEVPQTPGGTHSCQESHGRRVGEGQQPKLHCDLVQGGKGQLSRPVSCGLRERLQIGLLADFR